MRQITTTDLRRLDHHEELILQDCGGDPQEWIDGINGLLTDAGILLGGSRFENVSSFEHDGLHNLLFNFEGVKLNYGKLAMWRLQTHEQFGGTWLSDYVDNRLGDFIQSYERGRPDRTVNEQSNEMEPTTDIKFGGTDRAYYPGQGGGAADQHGNSTNTTWEAAQPGDLVFYPGDEHVGIVGGRDEDGDLLIIHCASGYNNVVVTGIEGFVTIAAPYYL